jgi:hypothetical protein
MLYDILLNRREKPPTFRSISCATLSYLILILSSFIAVGIVSAQVNTASLTGLVKDSSEAAIVKAKITALHRATGVERTTETDSGGSYFLPILPVGEYDLSVEASGFKKANVSVTLETGQRPSGLLAGSGLDRDKRHCREHRIAAFAAGRLARPRCGRLLCLSFPLLLRSWDDLMAVVPGVQGNRYTSQGGGASFGRTGGFSVHGNNFMLDDIDNNSISENAQELTTQVVRASSIDTIQETLAHERYNADWIEEQQVGLVVKSFSEVFEAVKKLLAPECYRRYRARTTQTRNFAVYEIPPLLEEILAKAPGWRSPRVQERVLAS